MTHCSLCRQSLSLKRGKDEGTHLNRCMSVVRSRNVRLTDSAAVDADVGEDGTCTISVSAVALERIGRKCNERT